MRRVNTLLFLAALSVAALGQTAHAADIIWDGDTSSDWTDGNNWVGGVAPADDTGTDEAIFNGAPTANQPSLAGARSVHSVKWDYPSGGVGGGWNLSGPGTLTLGTGNFLVENVTTGGTNTISVAGLVINNTDFTCYSGSTLHISSVISGSGLIKTSGGTLILSGLNTYTGLTLISRATVSVNTLADLGVPSALGAESDPNLGKIDMGSSSAPTLTYTGGATSTNRPINIGGSSASAYNINANGTGALTFTADLYATATGTNTHTLTLGGTNTADNTIGGIIPNAFGGPVAVTKTAAGKWVLSGASTYSGQTKVSGGTLQFNTILNVGAGASAFGAPATVANGTIDVGATTTAGTLRYTGGVQSTDRKVNLAGTTGGATIDASGSGALTFTSAFTATGAGAKTLTLRGTNTGLNTIGGAIVNNSAVNTTSLTKNDAGTWVLGGTNTYTGATNVLAGTLLVNGNNLAATGAVTVNGATAWLGGTGTIGGATTITDGTLSPGNSIGTLDFASNLTINDNYFWEYSGGPPVDPLGGDVANVAGTLTISALATLAGDNLGIAAALGTKFLLFNYQTAGAQLAFGNAPNLSQIWIDGQYWRIDYNDPLFGTSVNIGEGNGYAHGATLTAVPELGSFITMGLVGCFAWGAARFGKRHGFKVLRV